ncbi:MAG: 16S rRNA (adenine(1518)-N(6)/adenine(1519)-N(6))-dimethyltransferase RsmA [Bacteroidota bacterium]
MVKPKKHLGQHFLLDLSIAEDIAKSLRLESEIVLEIGPGTGVLTQFLKELYPEKLKLIEIDRESIAYLKQKFPALINSIHDKDFLQLDLNELGTSRISIIGNYPYNISSQIVFKAIENREKVVELSGMFQKEVAERICAGPGSKTYGIMSVLSQAYFKAEYLFSVPPNVFNPPPKVDSGVIRLSRFRSIIPDCDEAFFIRVVKQAFNQRRKTLRNALKPLLPEGFKSDVLQLRAERLSAENFIELSREIIDKS